MVGSCGTRFGIWRLEGEIKQDQGAVATGLIQRVYPLFGFGQDMFDVFQDIVAICRIAVNLESRNPQLEMSLQLKCCGQFIRSSGGNLLGEEMRFAQGSPGLLRRDQ